MLKYFRISLLLVLLLFSAKAYPQQNHFNCINAQDLRLGAIQNGYAYVATAISHPAAVVQFFVNLNTLDWIMIGIDDKDQGCVLMTGYSFEFAMIGAPL